ncbi:MAG: D-ribose pyranase [Eubacteriales bacterium]|nr:D-ribose pyranase [Eubacteriales bacterium]
MKKGVPVNAEVSTVITQMGHTDTLTAVYPIAMAKRFHPALMLGVPGFLETLDTVLSELYIQKAVLAEEIRTVSPDMHRETFSRLGDKVKIQHVLHEEWKMLSENARVIANTGKCTFFANVILITGVAFNF